MEHFFHNDAGYETSRLALRVFDRVERIQVWRDSGELDFGREGNVCSQIFDRLDSHELNPPKTGHS